MYTALSVRSITIGPLLLLVFTACGTTAEPDAGTSAYGDPCDDTTPCLGGLSCISNDLYVDGYCTETCESAVCGAGASCDTATSPPLCLRDCAGPSDCRGSYQCWRGGCRPLCRGDSDCGGTDALCGAAGVCEGVECRTSAECGSGQLCRSGECVEAPPVPDAGPVGAPPGTPCTRDDECADDVCLSAELGGVCSLPCTQPEDCFVFATEGGCSALAEPGAPTVCVVGPAGGRGVAETCTVDDDCLARVCQDGQCAEVCSDVAQCVPGMRCTELERAGAGGSTYRGCGYPSRSSVSLLETTFGRFDVRAGFVEEMVLATPADAVSVTLQIQHRAGPARDVSFFYVRDPAGTQLFDVAQIAMLNDQPIRWLPAGTYDSATMLIPNTTPDRVTFVPGLHRWAAGPIPAMAGDTATPNLRFTAIVKRSPTGSVTSGVLDLNIHLVGIRGLNASNASSNTKMRASLARLDTILMQAGVRLGTVSYFDITGPDATAYRVIDSTDGADSELANLFRLSAGRSGNSLDIFFVRSINADGGAFGALGVAGGIPGPVGMHGTAHSGVAAAFADGVVGSGAAGGQVVGQILAHEIGHYVGLFHSTERARPCGAGEDPTADMCAPFGGGDQLADTSYGDMRNLMYWSIVGGGTNTALTNGQGHVYRMSALTR